MRSEPETPRGEVYEYLRPLLFSIAYGIVSSVSEAEDIVQEAFLRFHRAQSGGADIDSPRPWLSTVTTRLAINHVRSARARRETYVGTWLPEPLLTEPAPDASHHAETADSLSLAGRWPRRVGDPCGLGDRHGRPRDSGEHRLDPGPGRKSPADPRGN